MRCKDDDGQAIVLVAVAASFFLIGAIGLGIDGSHLYAQRQMAQAAADSSAIAGIMSVFDGTYNSGTAQFTLSPFTCSSAPASTPCIYSKNDGFDGTATGTTVTVDFPTSAPGVSLATVGGAGGVPANLLRVTVSRQVNTTILRLLRIVGGGASAATVTATATAAIVSVSAPVPILVTHPFNSGSFNLSGNPSVTICGGPHRSIQVNSTSTTANTSNGAKATIDLSHAGPPDPGNCTTGQGSDFGTTGNQPTEPFGTFTVGNGMWQPKASPIKDPLANVPVPPVPTNTGSMGTHTLLANGTSGCPASPKKSCQLYYPGLYTGGIDGKLQTPVFVPGIYYIQSTSGFDCSANCDMYMATGFTDTYTGTGWTGNVLFYNTGSTAKPTNAGAFNLGSNGTINLVGSPTSSVYKGILFFQDRNSAAQSHTLGGGGQLTLQGTVYLNNTTMTATTYQSLSLQGGPGSGTLIQGEIIVGTLALGGNGGITMNLNSTAAYIVNEIALVN